MGENMNMNKKLLTVLLFVLSFFIFGNKVYAETSTNKTCNSITTQEECSVFSKCRWISGSCQDQFVAQDPCSDNNIRTVLKMAGFVLLLAKLAVPLLIIGFGVMDLYKSVIDKDEKSLAKQTKRLIMRIVTGVLVFFIPTIIEAIFNMSDRLNIIETDEYKMCSSCLFSPFGEECSTTAVFEE